MTLNLVVGQRVLDKFQQPGGSTPIDRGVIRSVTDRVVIIEWEQPSYKAERISLGQAKALLINDGE